MAIPGDFSELIFLLMEMGEWRTISCELNILIMYIKEKILLQEFS